MSRIPNPEFMESLHPEFFPTLGIEHEAKKVSSKNKSALSNSDLVQFRQPLLQGMTELTHATPLNRHEKKLIADGYRCEAYYSSTSTHDRVKNFYDTIKKAKRQGKKFQSVQNEEGNFARLYVK